MTGTLASHAPAKVNLTLHVLGRRADGHHELESLVAFAGAGDHLVLQPGPRLSAEVRGPTAHLSGEADDNLVLVAAHRLLDGIEGIRVGHFTLTKRLPVAAGIGGGSSDAAAALRLLARLNGLSLSDTALVEAARRTGADVPVCLEPHARMMRGAGESLGPELGLAPLSAVLVNPGIPVATPRVFAALGLMPGEVRADSSHPAIAHPAPQPLLELLRVARNDLEPAALSVVPAIADVIASLRNEPGCQLARMSGSGATVFGLFVDWQAAAAAARNLRQARPGWWVRGTILR
ncbi:4-(cytidine 5'-diphospho)-2-C-methyl-D-erythritol kinase [Microvirga massiliensis]|uniref:4-(cytidine 5'-diphospho)-2-C-methyl-D-erythritol kinase n=1 Tax=Microvirga massiliensis TaxID=1033741 RepID=UPI00062BDC79|nr:4-(cytidine 5'-diphospho)-2-C-methyl-D-erythritol kinase [Microvirga massiliensis]